MPVVPNFVERALMRLGIAPPFLTEVVNAGALRAFMAARRLGVLARLDARPMSLGELAEATDTGHPSLAATVLDLPEALTAQRTLDPSVAARMTFRPADILRDELGGPYDAVLVFQLLHYFPPATNAALLSRVYRALRSGGSVVILDQVRGAAPTPLASAFFALLALTYRMSLGGDLYSYGEITSWLREAGFKSPRRRALRSAPGNALIVASA